MKFLSWSNLKVCSLQVLGVDVRSVGECVLVLIYRRGQHFFSQIYNLL